MVVVPLPAWGMIVKTLATFGRPAIGQVGLCAGFIQKDQLVSGPLLLILPPKLAFLAQVSAILFAPVEFFLYR